MSSDALEHAVKNNLDPWATVVAEYHLDHPLIKSLAQGLLREYWNGRGGVGETLSDARKVYDRLARNPANRELLKKPEARDWLNRAVTQAYNMAYEFAWGS